MDQLLEFASRHLLLVGALAIVILALIANELWRKFTGMAPISSAEAIRLMNSEDAVIVDTRSASDFKKKHIINAKHVPTAGIVDRAKEISKDPDKAIIIYCGTGHSAQQAATKLRKHGYSRVLTLKGGIGGWEADGMPVTRK